MCTEPGKGGLGRTGSRESAPPIGSLPCRATSACHPMYEVIPTILFAARRVGTAYVSPGDRLNDLGVITVPPYDVPCAVIKQEQGSSVCSDRK